jgi:hypothetical protein
VIKVRVFKSSLTRDDFAGVDGIKLLSAVIRNCIKKERGSDDEDRQYD